MIRLVIMTFYKINYLQLLVDFLLLYCNIFNLKLKNIMQVKESLNKIFEILMA